MKDRKILIIAFLTSILLTGCGARNESAGFVEVEKERIITTTTTVMETKAEATVEDNEEDDDDDLYDNESDNRRVGTTRKQTHSEPSTIIPDSNVVVTTTTNQVTTKAPESVTTTTQKAASTTTTETLYEEPMTTETTQTTQTTTTFQPAKGIQEVPDIVLEIIKYWESYYPGIEIGYGLYSLDGLQGYEYNAYSKFNSACSIKLSYANYVLQECESKGIDIYSETLEYQDWEKDDGTSVISEYGTVGSYYTIDELLSYLLRESDNTAYTMLSTKFPINGMFQLIAPIGGQDDWNKWGRASVVNRKNEWLLAYRFMNSGSEYGAKLREYVSGSKYCYIVQCMQGFHGYLHKSGWTEDEPNYPAANDCAIIDDKYLLVVMTQDYKDYKVGHYEVVQALGVVTETFVNQNGNIF